MLQTCTWIATGLVRHVMPVVILALDLVMAVARGVNLTITPTTVSVYRHVQLVLL